MTYGEERLHFPDNLKPEKKSSKGWILIFMAVCIVCGSFNYCTCWLCTKDTI